MPLIAVVAGGGLCIFAEGLGGLALIWFVLQATEGAGPIGLLAAISLGAAVLSSLLGGYFVDRFGARQTALVALAINAAPLAAIGFLVAAPEASLAAIFVLVVVAQLPDGAVATAFEARLPELAAEAGIPLEQLNAIDDLVDTGAAVAAPLAAGVLIVEAGVPATVGIALAILLTVPFVAAAFLPGDAVTGPAARGVFGGFRYLLRRADLLALMAAAALLVAVFQSLDDVVLPVLVESAGHGPDALGLVLATVAVGAAAGAAGFLCFGRAARPPALFFAGAAVIVLGLAAVMVSSAWPVLLAAATAVGLAAGALSPLVTTALQKAAPAALRGRVLSCAGAFALSLAPASAGASGLAIDALGVPFVLAISIVLVLAAGVLGARAFGAIGRSCRSRHCQEPSRSGPDC